MIRGRIVTRMSNQGVCREKRTNRDLWPAIRVLRIGRRGGGCDAQPAKDDFTIAPPMRVVKRFTNPVRVDRTLFVWAVDNCRMRLADCAVKAVSRAAARAEQSEAP